MDAMREKKLGPSWESVKSEKRSLPTWESVVLLQANRQTDKLCQSHKTDQIIPILPKSGLPQTAVNQGVLSVFLSLIDNSSFVECAKLPLL